MNNELHRRMKIHVILFYRIQIRNKNKMSWPGNDGDENIKTIHYKMTIQLSENIHPVIKDEWAKLCNVLSIYLAPATIRSLNNMGDVCSELQKRGYIDYGRYDTLKRLLGIIENVRCCLIIDQCMKEMQDAQQAQSMILIYFLCFINLYRRHNFIVVKHSCCVIIFFLIR